MQKISPKLILALGLLLVWAALFLYCAHTHSKPLIDKLPSVAGLEKCKLFFEVLLTWTWTNLLFLCLLASLTGELARDSNPNPCGALARAFFVFLLAISGQVLFIGEVQFHLKSQEDYFRIAGAVSLLSYAAGYNPRIFLNLLRRFEAVGTEKPPKTASLSASM